MILQGSQGSLMEEIMKNIIKNLIKTVLVVSASLLFLVSTSAVNVRTVSAEDAMRDYTFTVHTAASDFSYTLSYVNVMFIGEKGKTEFVTLNGDYDRFENDSDRTFTVHLKDVGKVTAIGFELENNPDTWKNSWQVASVTFEGQKYQTVGTNEDGYLESRWIGARDKAESEGEGYKPTQEQMEAAMYTLELTDANLYDTSMDAETREYKTTIKTGGNPTNADVKISYYGDYGHTETQTLENGMFQHDFAQNSSKEYEGTFKNVGPATKIMISLEDDTSDNWRLAGIAYNGTEYPVDRLLSGGQYVIVDLATGEISGTAQNDTYGSAISETPTWAIAAGAGAIIVVIAGVVIYMK